MNLLGNVLYDPAAAVTKGTVASVLAVFDTTNARIAFVVPPSGMVRVVIQCVVHGAATFTQIVLGCLEGATVRGRVVPVGSQNGTALATTMMSQIADYVVSGLTPGASLNWDAAWGIETFVASSLIKYGGPNNTTANDAFGALVFQIWDPCPIYTPASGTPPTIPISTRLDTVDDFIDTEVSAIKTKTDFLPSATAGAAGGVFIAGTNAATTITTGLTTTFTGNLTGSVGSVTGLTAANLDATISSRMASYTQPTGFLAATFPAGTVANTTNITAGTITTATNLTNAPTAGDFTATMKTSIGTAVAASAVASVTGNVGGNVTGSVGSVTGLTASNLDATVSSRLATASYTAPPTVGAIRAEMDANSTSLAAIKGKTDSLGFNIAGYADVNVRYVNGTPIVGDGQQGSTFGP